MRWAFSPTLIMLQPEAKVFGMPIGGSIFAHANFAGTGAKSEEETARPVDFVNDNNLFRWVQTCARVGTACANALGSQKAWQCQLPTTVYPFVKTPMLVVESQIDSVIIFGFGDLPPSNTHSLQIKL